MNRFTSLAAKSIGLAAACLALGPGPSWAADKPAAPDKPASAKAEAKKPPARSLDDQLLDDLDADLVEPTDGQRGKRPAAEPGGAKTPIDGEDVGSGPEDPLGRVGRQMRAVEGLIEKLKSADETETRQQKIVADLAKIIEQLEQQCQSKSSSQQKSSKQQMASRDKIKQPKNQGKPGDKPATEPAKDSNDRLRKDELKAVDMSQMKGLLKDLWGQLPLRDREQMLQSSPEQFLPKYELLIEKFYKRLAEEQRGGGDRE